MVAGIGSLYLNGIVSLFLNRIGSLDLNALSARLECGELVGCLRGSRFGGADLAL